MSIQPKVVALCCLSTVTCVKQRVVWALVALEGPPTEWTPWSAIPAKQRNWKTSLSAPEEIPKGRGTPLGTVGSSHGYHPHGQREEGEGKTTKNETPQSQKNSAFGKIKQWLPPMQFTLAASVGTTTIVKIKKFTHMLFTQGKNSIAEGLHCKNHSWVQPQMS